MSPRQATSRISLYMILWAQTTPRTLLLGCAWKPCSWGARRSERSGVWTSSGVKLIIKDVSLATRLGELSHQDHERTGRSSIGGSYKPLSFFSLYFTFAFLLSLFSTYHVPSYGQTIKFCCWSKWISWHGHPYVFWHCEITVTNYHESAAWTVTQVHSLTPWREKLHLNYIDIQWTSTRGHQVRDLEPTFS